MAGSRKRKRNDLGKKRLEEKEEEEEEEEEEEDEAFVEDRRLRGLPLHADFVGH